MISSLEMIYQNYKGISALYTVKILKWSYFQILLFLLLQSAFPETIIHLLQDFLKSCIFEIYLDLQVNINQETVKLHHASFLCYSFKNYVMHKFK